MPLVTGAAANSSEEVKARSDIAGSCRRRSPVCCVRRWSAGSESFSSPCFRCCGGRGGGGGGTSEVTEGCRRVYLLHKNSLLFMKSFKKKKKKKRRKEKKKTGRRRRGRTGFGVRRPFSDHGPVCGGRSSTLRLNRVLCPPLHLSWAAPEKQHRGIHQSRGERPRRAREALFAYRDPL